MADTTPKLPALPWDLDTTNPRLTIPLKVGELVTVMHQWGREVYASAQQAAREAPAGDVAVINYGDPAATTASASQVDPSMALPHRTAAEWGVPFGVLTPEYKAEQAAKNARARAALEQLAVDESEGGHHD